MRLSVVSTTLREPGATDLEAREQPRSSMFLAAALRAGNEQAGVKVRNMSSSGAMIETPLCPIPGSEVHLVRGALLVQGTVVWRSGKCCGLRFHSECSVTDWLAARAASEQQRVDQVVALVKAGKILPRLADSAVLDVLHPPRSQEQLADDLGLVITLMHNLEDDLASSDETLARHGMKMQNLDIAMQMLRAVSAELTAQR